MAIGKICDTLCKDTSYPIVLVQGIATSDAEDKPWNEKEHSVVGVHAVTKSDGTVIYVDINGWGNLYDSVLAVHKGDSVLAIGTLKINERGGKKYYNVNASFIAISGAGLCDIAPKVEPEADDPEPPCDDADDASEELAEPRFTQKKSGKKSAKA